MPMFKRGCAILLLLSSWACSGGSPSPTPVSPTPTPAPISTSTTTFYLTGIATDDDGAPVVGAAVTVHTLQSPLQALAATTDGSGSYSVVFGASHIGTFPFALVKTESPGHETFLALLPPASQTEKSQKIAQNLHLYRIKRITAGESTVVTIVPGDADCGFDDELACRTVHVVMPTDGLLTMSCDPRGDDNGGLGLTIVGYNDKGASASPKRFAAGEVAVDIGMWYTSTVSQSCVFKTSWTP